MANNLPTISELYASDSLSTINKDAVFQVLVNQIPKKEWVKQHPIIKKKVNGENKPWEYIPIERVEWLLTNIFVKTRVEIKTVSLIGNSVVVTVRLFYFNQIDKEWDWQDGVGAQPLQTDSGAGAIEFDKLKSGAVQMAAPAAESYAVRDAAEKIGKLFGKDLNRDDQTVYDNMADKFSPEPTVEELQILLDQKVQFLDKDQFNDAKRVIETKEVRSYKKLLKMLTDFV